MIDVGNTPTTASSDAELSAAFEVTKVRPLLLVFPNLFENFYLYVTIVRKWFPRLIPRTIPALLLVLVVLLVPKLVQEYTLHFAQFRPWQWIKATLSG